MEIIAPACSHNEKSTDDSRETGRESRAVTASLQRSRRKAASLTAVVTQSAGSCWVFTSSRARGAVKVQLKGFASLFFNQPLSPPSPIPHHQKRPHHTEKNRGTTRGVWGQGEEKGSWRKENSSWKDVCYCSWGKAVRVGDIQWEKETRKATKLEETWRWL